MVTRARSRPAVFVMILILALVTISSVAAGPGPMKSKTQQLTLASYELLGTVSIPTGAQFAGTEIGGLSSLDYDPRRGVYYSISDDQGTIDPVRYYTLAIDIADAQLDPGDINFVDVTTILDENGAPYAPGSLDPEGLTLAREGQLYYTSEGFASRTPPVDPFVKRMNLNGKQTRFVVIPDKFLPDAGGTQGVRNNLAFESLNTSPNQRYLWTAIEGALVQDGPVADVGQESFARLVKYRLSSGRAGAEYVYVVNPVAEIPNPPGAFRVNGLVDLLPFDNAGTMLAMERSFSVGAGNTVWLYEIEMQGATDVSGLFSLYPNGTASPPAAFTPVTKHLILDVEADLGIEPDNLEGMAFGPPLADGRLPLILVSDNNFNPGQTTQFIALAVELAAAD